MHRRVTLLPGESLFLVHAGSGDISAVSMPGDLGSKEGEGVGLILIEDPSDLSPEDHQNARLAKELQ